MKKFSSKLTKRSSGQSLQSQKKNANSKQQQQQGGGHHSQGRKTSHLNSSITSENELLEMSYNKLFDDSSGMLTVGSGIGGGAGAAAGSTYSMAGGGGGLAGDANDEEATTNSEEQVKNLPKSAFSTFLSPAERKRRAKQKAEEEEARKQAGQATGNGGDEGKSEERNSALQSQNKSRADEECNEKSDKDNTENDKDDNATTSSDEQVKNLPQSAFSTFLSPAERKRRALEKQRELQKRSSQKEDELGIARKEEKMEIEATEAEVSAAIPPRPPPPPPPSSSVTASSTMPPSSSFTASASKQASSTSSDDDSNDSNPKSKTTTASATAATEAASNNENDDNNDNDISNHQSEIPEESTREKAKRRAIQKVMKDKSLSAVERSKEIQKIIKGEFEYHEEEDEEANAKEKEDVANVKEEGKVKVETVKVDESIQNNGATGGTATTVGAAAAADTATEFKSEIPEESEKQLLKRRAIQSVMKDTSLSAIERHERIQQIIKGDFQVEEEKEENDSSNDSSEQEGSSDEEEDESDVSDGEEEEDSEDNEDDSTGEDESQEEEEDSQEEKPIEARVPLEPGTHKEPMAPLAVSKSIAALEPVAPLIKTKSVAFSGSERQSVAFEDDDKNDGDDNNKKQQSNSDWAAAAVGAMGTASANNNNVMARGISNSPQGKEEESPTTVEHIFEESDSQREQQQRHELEEMERKRTEEEHEAELLKQQELEHQRQMEIQQQQRDKELMELKIRMQEEAELKKLQKQRELELQRHQQELELQQQRAIEEEAQWKKQQKQRELELQNQIKELELQQEKQRRELELKMERQQRELELQRQLEQEMQRQRELELEQQQRELEFQREMERQRAEAAEAAEQAREKQRRWEEERRRDLERQQLERQQREQQEQQRRLQEERERELERELQHQRLQEQEDQVHVARAVGSSSIAASAVLPPPVRSTYSSTRPLSTVQHTHVRTAHYARRTSPFEPNTATHDGITDEELNWRLNSYASLSDFTIVVQRALPGPLAPDFNSGNSQGIDFVLDPDGSPRSDVYHVHKVMLAVGSRRSEYLGRLIREAESTSGGWDGSSPDNHSSDINVHETIMLESAADAMGSVLDFCYYPDRDLETISIENAVPLVYLAKRYKIRALQSRADAFVKDHLDSSTAVHFLLDSYLYRLDDILNQAIDMTAAHLAETVDFDPIYALPPELFRRIILSWKLECGSELLSLIVYSYCGEHNPGKIDIDYFREITTVNLMPLLDAKVAMMMLKFYVDLIYEDDADVDIMEVCKDDSLVKRCITTVAHNWREEVCEPLIIDTEWEDASPATRRSLPPHEPAALHRALPSGLQNLLLERCIIEAKSDVEVKKTAVEEYDDDKDLEMAKNSGVYEEMVSTLQTELEQSKKSREEENESHKKEMEELQMKALELEAELEKQKKAMEEYKQELKRFRRVPGIHKFGTVSQTDPGVIDKTKCTYSANPEHHYPLHRRGKRPPTQMPRMGGEFENLGRENGYIYDDGNGERLPVFYYQDRQSAGF